MSCANGGTCGGSPCLSPSTEVLFRADLCPGVTNFVVACDQGGGSVQLFPIGPDGSISTSTTTAIDGLGNYVSPSPNKNFLYALTDGGNTITAYGINADGSLTQVGSATPNNNEYKEYLSVEPQGRFLYAAQTSDDAIEQWAIDPSSGLLTAIANPAVPFANAVSEGVAFDPFGRFVYLACQGVSNTDSAVEVYAINQATGALTFVQSANLTDRGPYLLAVTPDGKYLITGDTGYGGNWDGSVSGASAFSVNQSTGIITLINSYNADSKPVPFQIASDKYGNIYEPDYFGSGTFAVIQNGTGTITNELEVSANGFAGVASFGQSLYLGAGSTIYQFLINPSGPTLIPYSTPTVGTFAGIFSLSIARYS